MAGEIVIPVLEKIEAESRVYLFDFSRYSEVLNGETLSSPTIPAVSGITIGSPTIMSADLDGVPSGKGVKVLISSGSAGTTYTIDCRVTTSGGATLVRRVNLRVR